MPSFLSKVFGRKKGEEKETGTPRSVKRISDPSLLEGRFEAVPSTVSPSAPKFPEDPHASDKGKDKGGDKGGPFGLLRSKSRPQPSSPTTDAPHLTLRLPGTIDKNDDSLAASFNPQADETDDSILTRRLTPAETLLLIDACSKAITERGGLETLGVMRPHWHSASPQLQRKLISLFIHSLAQKSPETTLAPSTSASAAFNSELEYTRSVHDIAAVFRWALRHLKIEGASFGSSSSSNEWSWYHNFCESERKSAYDPRVFTAGLVPEIPPTHATLLIPTLDIISSLAAHAEANGYSGSKLSKYFGFWLLTARRAAGTEDWSSFYTRWEVSGRMLEHLFLSWLRDENTKRPLPRRLQELVAQYPYTTSSGPTVDGLLTRPRFSTRRHDALFVRVEAVYADNVQTQPSRSPVGIFADALKSESKADSGEHVYLWDQVKAAATADSDGRPLVAILSDDTINLLSLVSTDPQDQVLLGIPGAASTLVTPLSPITESLLSATANGNGISAPIRKPTIPTSSTPQSPKDWTEFSSAGFGEVTLSKNFASTLLDKDVEVTEPPVERKPSKRKQGKSTTTSTRTSAEFSSPVLKSAPAPEEPDSPKLALIGTEIVQLDEAFVDFWRDAVVDPVSTDWPTFVLVELKHPLTPHSVPTSSEEVSPGTSISWVIVEEKFRRPAPPPTPVIPPETSTTGGLRASATPLKRTSSPRPSFGEKKGSLSSTFKRFTLFGGSKDDLADDGSSDVPGSSKKDISGGGRKKPGASKSPRIGEMGEVLSEEPEPVPEVPKRVDEPRKVEKKETGKGEVVAAAAGVVGGGAVLATVGAVKDIPRKEEAKAEVRRVDSTIKDDKLPVPPQDNTLTERIPIAPVSGLPIASTTGHEPPTSVVEEPEAQKPLPEVPLVFKDRPVVSEEVIPEPIVDEPTPTTFPTETEPQALPPAPESVVSHGETPGPQLALDSTEAGLHHVPEPATQVEEPQESTTEPADIPPARDTEETASFGTQSPTIEHLEDKVEDPAADAGVDLEPVPIIPSDPVEPVGVEEPKPVETETEVAETLDVTSTEPPATTGEEQTAQEDVPAAQTPAPVLAQEPESTSTQSIAEGETDVPPPPPEEPQPDTSPLLPVRSVPSEPEPESRLEGVDVAPEDVTPLADVPDVSPSEPAAQSEPHPPSEEATNA